MLTMAYLLAHSLRRVFGVDPTEIVRRGRGATRRRSFRRARRRLREVDWHSRGTERRAAVALANHRRRLVHVDLVLRGFLDSLQTNEARNGRQTSTGGGRACTVSDLQIALQTISWSPTVVLSKSRKYFNKSLDSKSRLLMCSTSLSVFQLAVCHATLAEAGVQGSAIPSATGVSFVRGGELTQVSAGECLRSTAGEHWKKPQGTTQHHMPHKNTTEERPAGACAGISYSTALPRRYARGTHAR